MLKLSENPPILPPPSEAVADLLGQWRVAHTKARFEKALAWDLLGRGIGYFLPMIERVRVSGGRKRRVLLPLFPSYVFLCGTEEDRYDALATNRICQVIEVSDQAGLVDELTAIERAIKGNAQLDSYPQVAVGQRCRISAGLFQGLEGIVIQRSNKARFVLQINFISQGAVMEVDADLLDEI